MPGPPARAGRLGPWSEDGRFLYVTEREGAVFRVFRLNFATGEKMPWKEIRLADPAGIARLDLILAPDGKTYAYTCARSLSKLFLVEGFR